MDLPLAIRPCFIKGHAARFFWLTCTKGQGNLFAQRPEAFGAGGIMRAARKPYDHSTEPELNENSAQSKTEAAARPAPETRSPLLCIRPFICGPQPRRFQRVPTHVVGVHPEQRHHPRAKLALPLRLRRVASELEPFPVTLVTRNISSTGVYFLCPRPISPGTPIELEVALVHRPLGRGSVYPGKRLPDHAGARGSHRVRCHTGLARHWSHVRRRRIRTRRRFAPEVLLAPFQLFQPIINLSPPSEGAGRPFLRDSLQ